MTTVLEFKNIFFDGKIKLFLLLSVIVWLAMAFMGPRETLDIKFYYSAEEARTLLQGLGPEQITAYFNNEILDLFFILCYSVLGYLFFSRLITTNKILAVVALIPGVIDLFETVFIIFLLAKSEFADVPIYLGVVTLLKWITGGVLVLLLIIRLFTLFSPLRSRKDLRDQI